MLFSHFHSTIRAFRWFFCHRARRGKGVREDNSSDVANWTTNIFLIYLGPSFPICCQATHFQMEICSSPINLALKTCRCSRQPKDNSLSFHYSITPPNESGPRDSERILQKTLAKDSDIDNWKDSFIIQCKWMTKRSLHWLNLIEEGKILFQLKGI